METKKAKDIFLKARNSVELRGNGERLLLSYTTLDIAIFFFKKRPLMVGGNGVHRGLRQGKWM